MKPTSGSRDRRDADVAAAMPALGSPIRSAAAAAQPPVPGRTLETLESRLAPGDLMGFGGVSLLSMLNLEHLLPRAPGASELFARLNVSATAASKEAITTSKIAPIAPVRNAPPAAPAADQSGNAAPMQRPGGFSVADSRPADIVIAPPAQPTSAGAMGSFGSLGRASAAADLIFESPRSTPAVAATASSDDLVFELSQDKPSQSPALYSGPSGLDPAPSFAPTQQLDTPVEQGDADGAPATGLFVGTPDKKGVLVLDNTNKKFRFLTTDTAALGTIDTGKDLLATRRWVQTIESGNPTVVFFATAFPGTASELQFASVVQFRPTESWASVNVTNKAGKNVQFLMAPGARIVDTFDQVLPSTIETFGRVPFDAPNDNAPCQAPQPPAPSTPLAEVTPCVNELGFKVSNGLPANVSAVYKWTVAGTRGPLKRLLTPAGAIDFNFPDPNPAVAKGAVVKIGATVLGTEKFAGENPEAGGPNARGIEFESWPNIAGKAFQTNTVKLEIAMKLGADQAAQNATGQVAVKVLDFMTEGMWIDNGDNKFNGANDTLLRGAPRENQTGAKIADTFIEAQTGKGLMFFNDNVTKNGAYDKGEPVWFDSKTDGQFVLEKNGDFRVLGTPAKDDRNTKLPNVLVARMDEHFLWHTYFGPTAEGPNAPADKRGFEHLNFHRRFMVADFDAYRAANGLPAVANVTMEKDIPLMWPYPLRTGGGPTASTKYTLPVPDARLTNLIVTKKAGDATGFFSANELATSDQFRAWHGALHTFGCGHGDQLTFTSPRDPDFFWYHRLIDDLWSKWQAKGLPDYG